jgi:hypothetical protein
MIKTSKVLAALSASCLLLTACGGGDSDTLSTGLKIFVTDRTHSGDFANDFTLAGANVVAKADSFCMTDPARPDTKVYKALFVDGINRSATTPTDWVLKPSTVYYQVYNDVRIGLTSPAAIFPTTAVPLENPVRPAFVNTPGVDNNLIWTGLEEATTFTSSASNCAGWSDGTNGSNARWGRLPDTNQNAFATNGFVGCGSAQAHLYCVEQ